MIAMLLAGVLLAQTDGPQPIERDPAPMAAGLRAAGFEVVIVPGDQVFAQAAALRRPGITPIVVGVQEDLQNLIAQGAARPRPAEILSAASDLTFNEDYPAYFFSQVTDPEAWEVDAGGRFSGVRNRFRRKPKLERFDLTAEPLPGITHHLMDGAVLPRVHIALVPTDEAAAVPAFFGYGGWNAYPPPDHHVALLRKWQAAYGAELVAMTGDVVLLKVAQPPTTWTAALELAEEAFMYCPDAVSQGAGSVTALAENLMSADLWLFWWD